MNPSGMDPMTLQLLSQILGQSGGQQLTPEQMGIPKPQQPILGRDLTDLLGMQQMAHKGPQIAIHQQSDPLAGMSEDDIYRMMYPQGYYRDLFGVHGIGDPGGGDLGSFPPDFGSQGGGDQPNGPGGTVDIPTLRGGG